MTRDNQEAGLGDGLVDRSPSFRAGVMEAKGEHPLVLQDAMAFREDISELASEGSRIFILYFTDARGIRFVKPRVSVLEDRRKPREEKVTQLAVVHKVEVRRIRDNRVDRCIRDGESGAVSIQDEDAPVNRGQRLP